MTYRLPLLILAGLLAGPAWSEEFVCPGGADLYVTDSGWQTTLSGSFTALELSGHPEDLQTATCLATPASPEFASPFREVEGPCHFEGTREIQASAESTTCLFGDGGPDACRLVCGE